MDNSNETNNELQPSDSIASILGRCISEDARLFLEALQTHPNFAAVMETLVRMEGALHEEHIAQALLNVVKRPKQ